MKARWIAMGALVSACGPAAAPKQTTTTTTVDNTTKDPTDTPPPTDPPARDTSMCAGANGMDAIVLDQTQADGRYGRGAKTFADAPSTQEMPIEVCGVGGEMAWLLATKCADGSNPFGRNPDESRTGSVGQGGRCGMIIDLYPAACPEATYQVYVDFYWCGPNETYM